MSKASRGRKKTSYRSVGETYDGVRVIAPKTTSKAFTEADVRRAVRKALQEVGVEARDGASDRNGTVARPDLIGVPAGSVEMMDGDGDDAIRHSCASEQLAKPAIHPGTS